jgi:hypothetical protein
LESGAASASKEGVLKGTSLRLALGTREAVVNRECEGKDAGKKKRGKSLHPAFREGGKDVNGQDQYEKSVQED